jgi:hypothetical protein
MEATLFVVDIYNFASYIFIAEIANKLASLFNFIFSSFLIRIIVLPSSVKVTHNVLASKILALIAASSSGVVQCSRGIKSLCLFSCSFRFCHSRNVLQLTPANTAGAMIAMPVIHEDDVIRFL